MNSNRNLLIYLAIIHDGNYDAIMNAIYHRIFPSEEEVNEEVSKLKCNVLTVLDPNYPKYLKRMARFPLVLFYYGDISLINEDRLKSNLAVVGTRKATSYGLKNTSRIIKEMGDKVCIVSGLARGIDAQAHQAALNVGAKTIAVLGSGIDNPWPEENALLYRDIITHGGLVVSEYPHMSTPDMTHFPVRNRLIAMFAESLLVTEAYGYRTGTSITVGFANSYGRLVMCIPYPPHIEDSFCNQLLYEGATFVRNGQDILLELGLEEIKII